MAKARISVWQKRTVTKERRRRVLRRAVYGIATLLFLATCIVAYRQGWWPSLLDWAVVAIPGIAGLVAWVMPVQRTTTFHRVWLFIGGLSLSGLIYIQQWETRQVHAKEMADLATKEDVAKLPTIQQIGIEFRKATTEQKMTTATPAAQKQKITKSVPPSPVVPPQVTSPPADGKNPNEQITKGIDEIKKMLGTQRWGLSADQLVTLSQRMAPFADLVNSWSSGNGISITSSLADPDSGRFATSLVAALRSAGWKPGTSMGIFSGRPQGVIFVLHSKDDASLPVLNQFALTLKEAGIEYHGEISDSVPAGQFRIIVGGKPD